MRLLYRLSSFWRNLRDRERVDRALDEELRAYLELVTDAKIAEGCPPAETRRTALLELGGAGGGGTYGLSDEVGVAILPAVVALVAGYLPARKATQVDPVIALKYE